jgi:hypothetical protein
LIILGAIVIAIAVASGIMLFAGHSVDANKDGIVNDLKNLGSDAYVYKLRPIPFGGGGSAYTGYIIPAKFRSNDNAVYSSVPTDSSIIFTAVSKLGYGTISVAFDDQGMQSRLTCDGGFK